MGKNLLKECQFMQPTTAILIGAGDRGASAYAPYALDYPNELKIVAVAEPNDERREKIRKQHHLPETGCYTTWKKILCMETATDIWIITIMDKQHISPTMIPLELGYQVSHENAMSLDPQECIAMERQA